MSDDLWTVPIQDLMLNAAGRAAHYRQQAVALREMAERGVTDRLAGDLLELAAKYDALAGSVSR